MPTPEAQKTEEKLSLFTNTAAGWGIALTKLQIQQLERYATELEHWNSQHNLVSDASPQEVWLRHFLDSLRCAASWGNIPQSLVDIGSGAGFPGLPLKIAFPEIALTLVESVEKKTAFLKHIVSTLALEKVSVMTTRAETLGHMPEQRESYDVVTARAVAELAVLAEYCLPLLRIGGRFLAPKGAQITDELAHAEAAINILGGHILTAEPIMLPQQPGRSLVVIEKIAATPERYPRRVGLPTRKPLK